MKGIGFDWEPSDTDWAKLHGLGEAAIWYRPLYIVVFNSRAPLNSTLALHFTNSAASTSLKCFTVFTLSSMHFEHFTGTSHVSHARW